MTRFTSTRWSGNTAGPEAVVGADAQPPLLGEPFDQRLALAVLVPDAERGIQRRPCPRRPQDDDTEADRGDHGEADADDPERWDDVALDDREHRRDEQPGGGDEGQLVDQEREPEADPERPGLLRVGRSDGERHTDEEGNGRHEVADGHTSGGSHAAPR
jgi:hypothetical protein